MGSPPVLRPLRVGEILGNALAVYRLKAFEIWGIVAVVVALPSALTGALTVASRQSDGSSGPASFLPLLVLAVGGLSTLLATSVSYRLVLDGYLGRKVDPGVSLRFGLRRVASVIWVFVLVMFMYFALFFVVGLFAIGGVAAAVVGFLVIAAPAAYLFVIWSIAVPALLTEGLRGRAVIRRSHVLARGRGWPCLAVLALSLLLEIVIVVALAGAVTAIAGAGDNDTLLFFGSGIASLVSNVLTLPFQAAVATVLYVDLRVRKEGFDAQRVLRSLEPDGVGQT